MLEMKYISVQVLYFIHHLFILLILASDLRAGSQLVRGLPRQPRRDGRDHR